MYIRLRVASSMPLPSAYSITKLYLNKYIICDSTSLNSTGVKYYILLIFRVEYLIHACTILFIHGQ